MENIFKTSFRIYYEDTDVGGIVYYANYLKFAERARTEMLRSLGILQSELANTEKLVFVVRRLSMELLSPAKLDDYIEVSCLVKKISGASMDINQTIKCNDIKIAEISVLIVCVGCQFLKPTRIPKKIKELFI